MGRAPGQNSEGLCAARVLGRPPRLQEAARSSKRFPGPGDPRFSLRGRSVPSARGASISEKFPKTLDIAILVTFIF